MTSQVLDRPAGPELTYGYFGNIVKFDKLDDGTIMVFGKAAGADLDLDEQICDPAWLKTAMPKWFQWGNVREQHNGKIAAGVGVEMTEGEAEGDYYVRAHIVDPVTVKKVETRVLKGFSVGISNGRVVRDKAARGGRIDDGEIHELSLVDRPANATCSISIAKSADGVTFLPTEADEPELETVEPTGAELLAPELPHVGIDKATGPTGMDAKAYRAALRAVEDALAGEWSHAVPFITKAAKAASDDEHADVAGAHAAIGQIADLIISEAQGLKDGMLSEIRDIEVLIQAVRSLCCFIEYEQGEDTPGLEDHDVSGYEGDEGKAYVMAKAAGGAEDHWAEEPEQDRPARRPRRPRRAKAAGQPADDGATVIDVNAEITKAVAAAQAESARAHEAELAALRDQLEKAQAQPLTGGPVTFRHVTKTSSAPRQAPSPDDPAYWRTLADEPGISADIQQAYIAKAASLAKGAST